MEAVVFGRSPFLQNVDIPWLIHKYKTVGFNDFCHAYEVDYGFSYDDVVKPKNMAKELFIPHWSSNTHGTKVVCKPHQKHPQPFKRYEDGNLILSFCLFSPSLALNWLLLHGFKTVYLVGIDHVETDKQFKHFDNIERPTEMSPTAHQKFKSYVYQCAKIMNIYQTNPAVKSGWELPFKPVESIY